LNRDLNAAINIRNEGNKIKIGLSSPKLTPLESCVSISLVELGKECKMINEFN
jgi:transposase